MRGYILVDVNIIDIQGFKEYASRIPDFMEKHGGRYIVKDPSPRVVRDNSDTPQFTVLIEFPSVEAADQFIDERSRSDLVDIFNRSTRGRILRVEGCI